jgi:hypothetical protein
MKAQAYQWELSLNMEEKGRTAFLIDAYKNSVTPVNLSGITAIVFAVNNAPASYAADRFKIVFSQAIVPVTSSFKFTPDLQVNKTEMAAETVILYPNPAVNKIINLHFSNAVTTTYNIKLISQSGQVVYYNNVTVDGNTMALKPGKIATGNYQVSISGPGYHQMISVMIR